MPRYEDDDGYEDDERERRRRKVGDATFTAVLTAVLVVLALGALATALYVAGVIGPQQRF